MHDVEVSALTGKGLDTLLENIALQAELLELKANPDRQAEGAVIEAKLDKGRGPVATVLVQKGTLKRGDIFVVGEQWGRVRALINDKGERVDAAGPSVPVEVLGLSGTPEAGDVLNVVDDEARAREIADYRGRLSRDKRAAVGSSATLDQLLAKAKADKDVKELPVVVKSDVQGSAEAIVQALEKISTDEVRIRVLHAGVGAITEIGRDAGRSLGRADHRLQRPRQRAGARVGQPEGGRDPLLLDHLQPGRRREGGGLRPASAPRSARSSSATRRSFRSSRSPASARSPAARSPKASPAARPGSGCCATTW